MLRISHISKTYRTGDLVQQALDDVSLCLRDNEFVAILGPSGSGKTTLLNIIGGLDRYDEGDLIINNVSTQDYRDRDWDTYRNHTIGFVFQSYNLIPHQTILSNVELALTISGISRKERRERALNALDQVGLKEQAHKKPNQMSGGQMQRVAIARALVNNPDILLADEPTGALDSRTSLQVMDLLKEVARDRLVVMVTHNPELASQYANRIVNLRDGHIISDSNPYDPPQGELDRHPAKVKKAHMGFLTALSLSFNNLLTKKGRTILTAFAGSIGIIGIALILSLSTGFQRYIDKIQEDTLSSYPLTITSETADTTSAILSMVADHENNKAEEGYVIERQYMTTMFSSIGTNDLKTFKRYLEDHPEEYQDDVSYMSYTYSIQPTIYTIDATDKLVKLNPSSMGSGYSSQSNMMLSFSGNTNSVFNEMNDDFAFFIDQYKVLAGRWPQNYDEVIINLSEEGSISDLLVYSLGLRDTSELRTIISNVMSGEESGVRNDPLTFTYDELMNIDLRLIRPSDIYRYNAQYAVYEDMSDDEAYMQELYDKALKLRIVGIVTAIDANSTMTLSTGINYTRALTSYIIDDAAKTGIVQRQLRNRDIDVFSGKSFTEENDETREENRLDFNDMISIDEEAIANAFSFDISMDDLNFDMPSASQMQKIVMDSAQTAADMIAKTPDATLMTAAFTTLNGYMLNYELDAYARLPGSLDIETSTVIDDSGEESESETKYLVLDETKIAAIQASITPENYKKFLNTVINSVPELQQYAPILNMLDSEQFAGFAKDVSSMYASFYDQIRQLPDYDSEKQRILYDDTYPENIRYGQAGYQNAMVIYELTTNTDALSITSQVVNDLVNNFTVAMIAGQIGAATAAMMEPLSDSLSSLGDMFNEDMFKFDTDAFVNAFSFNMNQEDLSRLMETIMSGTEDKSAFNNLISLGYQDVNEPTAINFYFKDFDAKENFLAFLDSYNEKADEESQIRYTDITGILMSSVKTIVDVVTYVLIAFVSISLVVSSIMIAVITLISVMERTKEIGILRAMGASKRNVSSIFNAETFIIGLLSGGIGVGVTVLLLPPINTLIHRISNNYDVNAVLPRVGAIALILISVFLTIMAGIIPSRKASKQDPVIALRTE